MYVKVTMDGAPYPMALEKMFSCFITVILPLICRKLKIMRGSDAVGIAQSGLHKSSSKDRLTNGSKMDALKDLEYVLTYEDKDADWMLGGDLPWDYITSICRKLKIMRGSYAVGIAPRTIEQTGQNKCAWCLSAPTEDI